MITALDVTRRRSLDNDRPGWQTAMINVATGVTFAGFILLIVLLIYKVLHFIWNTTL
jgi:hypothetical protein